MPATALPPLPYPPWEETKKTLHRYLQIAGKVRLRLMPPQNHWWHVTFYVTVRGLTTGPIPHDGGAVTIDFDLADQRVTVGDSSGEARSFKLVGQPVATFYRQLFDALEDLGVKVSILARPFDLDDEVPFPEDDRPVVYDPEAVTRFHQVLVWADGLFERFRGQFLGKATPVHVFWHTFDLAYTRFSGRPAPPLPDEAGIVAREGYSHEVVSFGFWPGDKETREAAFYSYTWPEPEGLAKEPLEPAAAEWKDRGDSSLAFLPYEAVRTAGDPEGALLAFLASAYRAGSGRGDWPEGLERQ